MSATVETGQLHVLPVIFHRPKANNDDRDWEDGAGVDGGDPSAGRPARCIVVDGATDAYDSIRWAHQMVGSFLAAGEPGGAPELTDRAMIDWLALMQRRWMRDVPATQSPFEAQRVAEGSFATLLVCEIGGPDSPRPGWRAGALGDAVLFHVRDGALIDHFPRLAAGDFGTRPDGAYTRPDQLPRMRERLRWASGDLHVDDRLYLATDALAEWILRGVTDRRPIWAQLRDLDHPTRFRDLIDRERTAGAMKDDDVTMLRVEFARSGPDFLGVCR